MVSCYNTTTSTTSSIPNKNGIHFHNLTWLDTFPPKLQLLPFLFAGSFEKTSAPCFLFISTDQRQMPVFFVKFYSNLGARSDRWFIWVFLMIFLRAFLLLAKFEIENVATELFKKIKRPNERNKIQIDGIYFDFLLKPFES